MKFLDRLATSQMPMFYGVAVLVLTLTALTAAVVNSPVWVLVILLAIYLFFTLLFARATRLSKQPPTTIVVNVTGDVDKVTERLRDL